MATHHQLKNHLREIRLFQQRAYLLIAIIVLTAIALCARLIFLQVSEHHRYSKLSQHNILDLVPIPPKRGLIYDQNGILLADNQPSFSLQFYPEKITNLEQTLQKLAKLITLTDTELAIVHKQLRQHKPFRPVTLKLKLSETDVAKFSVNQYQFPGVFIKAGLIRRYPFADILAPALGYVGRFSDTDRKLVESSDYSGTELIGKAGLEQFYETALHGKVGIQRIEVNARNKPIRHLDRQPATAGNQLILSLDSKLQQAGYHAFGKHRGAAVAIDPNNGEILAFISHPSFDPNLFVSGIDQAHYQQLSKSSQQPLFNRALRGQFPFASTIKPFLALHALDSGIINAHTKIHDPGFFTLPHSTHKFHDWKPDGHGHVDVNHAIIVSCDTFFYHLAVLLGINEIDNALHHYRFGSPTHIDINGEKFGIVPSPDWKQRTQHTAWYPGDTVITGIGQGYLLATPLQLATATATLANQGQGYQPHLVRSQTHADGQTQTTPIHPFTPIEINTGHWQVITRAMHGVIFSPIGTGHRFGMPPYSVAGKTGTAQLYHNKRPYHEAEIPEKLRDHSIFIAFAPIEHPQIALAVVVENSPLAPTVARKMLDQFFATHPQHPIHEDT